MAEKHPSHSADAVTKPGRAANLYPFLDNTGPNLIGLMTLTYVPNYFDILPMYLVILALVARTHEHRLRRASFDTPLRGCSG